MSLRVLNVGYPLARVSPSTAGGAEQVISMLDEALTSAGHDSTVLAPQGSECQGKLIEVRYPAPHFDDKNQRQVRSEVRSILEEILQRRAFDVIHFHGVDFAEYLPHTDVPIVVTLHLPLDWYPSSIWSLSAEQATFVCVSRSQLQTFPMSEHIPVVIENGVPLRRYRVSKKKKDFALCLGRICPEKGFHLAIDACASASTPLVLAGEVFPYPEHRRYFEEQIRPAISSNVFFVGQVGGERKRQILGDAKCLLVPSLARETSSLVAMEAMSSGTPVIAFKSGALVELIAHGRTGFLVDNVQEMAEAIHSVEAISSLDCRKEAERRFSSERMTASYLRLYGELARGYEITGPHRFQRSKVAA